MLKPENKPVWRNRNDKDLIGIFGRGAIIIEISQVINPNSLESKQEWMISLKSDSETGLKVLAVKDSVYSNDVENVKSYAEKMLIDYLPQYFSELKTRQKVKQKTVNKMSKDDKKVIATWFLLTSPISLVCIMPGVPLTLSAMGLNNTLSTIGFIASFVVWSAILLWSARTIEE